VYSCDVTVMRTLRVYAEVKYGFSIISRFRVSD